MAESIAGRYATLAVELQMAMNAGNNTIDRAMKEIGDADALLAAHPDLVAALDKLGDDKLATEIITARATVANADARVAEIAVKINGAVADRQSVIDELAAETDPDMEVWKQQVLAFAKDAPKLTAALASKVDERTATLAAAEPKALA